MKDFLSTLIYFRHGERVACWPDGLWFGYEEQLVHQLQENAISSEQQHSCIQNRTTQSQCSQYLPPLPMAHIAR